MTITESFSPAYPELFIDVELPGADAPPAPAAGRSVIVWLHGGGWRLQDRTARPDFSRYFCPRGFAMASIDYRLAPDNPHPAQVHDLRQALRWLRASADRLGIDPARIALWGSSAGGHVAAYTALTSGIDRLQAGAAIGDAGAGTADWPAEAVAPEYAAYSTDVTCVVEGYGPAAIADLLPDWTASDPRRHTPEEDLLGGPAASPAEFSALQERARAASPALLTPTVPPPFFILHGTGDAMVPPAQSGALHDRLVELGGQSLLYLIEGFGHGFLNPGEVQELGPGVRLDNGRLESQPDAAFEADNRGEFDPHGAPATMDLIGRFFAFHLQDR